MKRLFEWQNEWQNYGNHAGFAWHYLDTSGNLSSDNLRIVENTKAMRKRFGDTKFGRAKYGGFVVHHLNKPVAMGIPTLEEAKAVAELYLASLMQHDPA